MATIHYKDKWRLWSWLLMGMERQITAVLCMGTVQWQRKVVQVLPLTTQTLRAGCMNVT